MVKLEEALSAIFRRRRGVSAATAWLFSQEFGTTPEFWLNLQTGFDLATHRSERTVPSLR